MAPTPKSKPLLALPNALNAKHGKLVQLYKQCVQYVKEEMHDTGRTEHKQTPMVDLVTGSVTVSVADKDKPIASTALFMMTLEQFRHCLRARDYLTESECHALLDWLTRNQVLGKKVVLLERTLLELLKIMDGDMSMCLVDIMRTRARDILKDQEEISDHHNTPDDTDKDIFRETAV